MALRRPLVRIGGRDRQLLEGDKLPVGCLPVGSSAETVAAGNDSRLSDARDWDAEVVPLAEAQARTATTPRKWTAQRVGDAFAFGVFEFWAAVTSPWSRDFLASVDAAEAREALELGETGDWDAEIVARAEAEAGIQNIARKWTALRDRQAFNSFFNAATTAFTRGLLGGSTAAQVRTTLGLGTAATRNATGTGDVLATSGGSITGPISNTSSTVAFHQSGNQGGSIATWNTRHGALRIDCPTHTQAYKGIHWYTTGKALAAIDAWAGGSASSTRRIMFHLGGTSEAQTFFENGGVTIKGTLTQSSDRRLKTEIETIPDALNKVCSLGGYTYLRTDTGERQTGVIAQEVQAVLPEAVSGDETLGVAYGNMTGLLIEAIKELRAELDELKGS